MTASERRWPGHGWLGLGLVIVFWILNWSLSGLRTHWFFFPQWLGYCLTVDALVFLSKGDSLLTRNPKAYVGLFLISAPLWWLFELLNLRLQNWLYLGRQLSLEPDNLFFDSLSFSTVIPAVFGTTELVGTFSWLKRIKSGPKIKPTPVTLWVLFASGWLMLLLLLIWPDIFFGFVWLSLYFIFEPVNHWRGNRTLIQHTGEGDWRPILALWLGCTICGFFWEMWNFYSYPKWTYDVPGLNFWHVFEMPLIGYLGYLPFSLELFALYHLIVGFTGRRTMQDYFRSQSQY
ncbi:hypothetical protein GWO43_04885 [candidate division KSB1 bacterium]|nr:hypothetical protein [candidate division KSB1 bacterium]NIR71420.1 hypothetical protein [candidate division KSB1 bacterium]NIS23341.1 hypothetical protein [candidate division KSB1 bacterium]NIT70232.1 hypothetical protein [candidate division KSB1 bacterium]NIU23955.1 hypothetical protein [candidate division KSB1 bacterium]